MSKQAKRILHEIEEAHTQRLNDARPNIFTPEEYFVFRHSLIKAMGQPSRRRRIGVSTMSFTITKKDLALLEDILQKYRLEDTNFHEEYDERIAFTTRVVRAVNVDTVCGECGRP